MIRREPQARFIQQQAWFEGSRETEPPGCLTFGLSRKKEQALAVRLECGKYRSPAFRHTNYEAIVAASTTKALRIGTDDRSKRQYWLFCGEFYSDVEKLEAEEVTALLIVKQRKRQARISTALASASAEGAATSVARNRPSISDDVKMFVWQRDHGRCVRCASVVNLEFDHVIPLSMGGSNSERNLQLLCETCNRMKSGELA